MICRSGSNLYGLDHKTDDGTVTGNLAVTPAVGDTVELLCQLSATGTVILTQSINSAASTSTTETAALTLMAAWSSPTLHINKSSGGDKGFNRFADILFVRGIHTLADCRKATQQ